MAGEARRGDDLQEHELAELPDAVAERALQVDAGQPPAKQRGKHERLSSQNSG
jgi:hypothetical protein